MKTHMELVEAAQVLNVRCNTLETFGTKTYGFIQWKSMPQRESGEAYLDICGFEVDPHYSPKAPYSMVRVSTKEARKLKTFDRWSPYSIKE